MTFIDRWPAWLRWVVIVPAILALFLVLPLVLSLGQWMAYGTAPGVGFLYGLLSKFLSSVLPPALAVLLAWRIAPRARLAVAKAATVILVAVHVLGLVVVIAVRVSGLDKGPDTYWLSLAPIVLGGIAAVLALRMVMDLEARRERAQLDLPEADRR